MRINRVSLEDRIERIREQLDAPGEISEVSSTAGEGDVNLQDELRALLNYIEQSKTELTHIQPRHLSENRIPEASDQLDQVIATTEEAASKIMDSAEEISEIALSLDGEVADRLMAISTHIFETSSFQDITGQRVTKVVATLKYLEEKLRVLASAIGDTDSHLKAEKEAEDIGADSDENLLQGPQSSATGNDQDAIDALFDSFD